MLLKRFYLRRQSKFDLTLTTPHNPTAYIRCSNTNRAIKTEREGERTHRLRGERSTRRRSRTGKDWGTRSGCRAPPRWLCWRRSSHLLASLLSSSPLLSSHTGIVHLAHETPVLPLPLPSSLSLSLSPSINSKNEGFWLQIERGEEREEALHPGKQFGFCQARGGDWLKRKPK